MAQISIHIDYDVFFKEAGNVAINNIYENLKKDRNTAKAKMVLNHIYLYVLSNSLGVDGRVEGKKDFKNVGVASGMLKRSLKAKSMKTGVIDKTPSSVTGVFINKIDLKDDSYGWYIGSNNESDYGMGGKNIVDKLANWIKQKRSLGAVFSIKGKKRYKNNDDKSIASNIVWAWRRGTSRSRLVLPFWYNMEKTKNETNSNEIVRQINEKMPIIFNSLSSLLN